MKVVCIDNEHTRLELYKIYEAIVDTVGDNNNGYIINSIWYFSSRFKTIEQVREEKLNILLGYN